MTYRALGKGEPFTVLSEKEDVKGGRGTCLFKLFVVWDEVLLYEFS